MMQKIGDTYTCSMNGTCSRMVSFKLDEENRVHDVAFRGGCNGNLKGISSLVDGLPAEYVIERCEGTTCGIKSTSCPDQFAKALRETLAEIGA